MLIQEKTSEVVKGKRYELREGTGGRGAELFIVQTLQDGRGCIHQEIFQTLKEAESWLKHACN